MHFGHPYISDVREVNTWNILWLSAGKGKGKLHYRTGHEIPEME